MQSNYYIITRDGFQEFFNTIDEAYDAACYHCLEIFDAETDEIVNEVHPMLEYTVSPAMEKEFSAMQNGTDGG
jgi:hypothetical protein